MDIRPVASRPIASDATGKMSDEVGALLETLERRLMETLEFTPYKAHRLSRW